MSDPRKRGFNYGAPLPIPAGYAPYDDALRLSERLRDVAHEASARAWKLDMAIRDYRHAVTAQERVNAQTKMLAVYTAVIAFSTVTPEDPRPDYPFADIANIGRDIARTVYQKDAAEV